MKRLSEKYSRFALLFVFALMTLGIAGCDVEVSQRIGESDVEVPEETETPEDSDDGLVINDEFTPSRNSAFRAVRRELEEYHYNQPSEALLWEGAIDGLLSNVSDDALIDAIDEALDLSVYEEETFTLVFTAINEYYDTAFTEADFWLFAKSGMIEILEDPYTVYITPEDIAQADQGLGEEFVGIGVTIEIVDNSILITGLFSDSPAMRAGLLPGDVITHVDGVDYRDRSYVLALDAITGEEGTPVEIGVARPGMEDTLYFTMVREVIPTPSVEGEIIEHEGASIAYIAINSFGQQTANLFQDYLNQFDAEGYDGMVVDVRNNGGGLLSTLEDILRNFLSGSANDPFFTIEYYEGTVESFYSSAPSRVDVPVTVLVNGFSASASEVFASAMYQQGGIDVIGETTFGKGSVQIPRFITGGGRLNLTYALWFTPENENVNGVGFEPNIVVAQNPYLVTPSLIVETEYSVGDEGATIEILQKILNTLGFGDALEENGVFNEATEAALTAYQDANDLEGTGVLDPLTASELSSDIYDYRIDKANDAQLYEALERVKDLIAETD